MQAYTLIVIRVLTIRQLVFFVAFVSRLHFKPFARQTEEILLT